MENPFKNLPTPDVTPNNQENLNEQPAKSEKIENNNNDVLNRVKTLLVKSVDVFLETYQVASLRGQDTQDLAQKIVEHENLNIAAADFFKEISSSSGMNVPTEVSQGQSVPFSSGKESEKMTRIKKDLANIKIWAGLEAYKDKRANLLKKLNKPGIEPIVKRRGKDYSFVRAEIRTLQGAGLNIIGEYLTEIENNVFGEVTLRNRSTGASLNITTLLPEGYSLVPVSLQGWKWDERGRGVRDIHHVKEYTGSQNLGDASFSLMPTLNRVSYGNLTKSGGILSLLHEISHAWQNEFSDKDAVAGKYTFETLYPKIREIVEDFFKYLSQHNFDTKNEAVIARIAETKKSLEDIGVAWYENDSVPVFSTDKPIEEEGVLNIQGYRNQSIDELTIQHKDNPAFLKEIATDAPKRYFPIRSEKLQDAINAFVAEERDAWAHALRVLRFLRQNGFDPEPEMKTVKDIKKWVHHALGSYENNLYTRIIMQKDDYHFDRVNEKINQ